MGSGKTGKENKLMLVAGLFVVLTIGLLISTVILGVKLKNKSKDSGGYDHDICNTPECVKAAGDILKAMNPKVDPCDNFYEFSCGSWMKNNPIPDTTSSWNQFNVLRDLLNRDIRGIVEAEIIDKEPNPVKLAKEFYKSCMGQNATDESELTDLIEVVLKLDDASSDKFGVKLGELRRRIGAQFFITLYVELDEADTSKYIIYVDQASLGLNRAFLVETEHAFKTAYMNLIQGAWDLVYPGNASAATQVAEDIVRFETLLAQITTPPEDRRDRTELYNLWTVERLASHTSGASGMIDWEEYLPEAFRDVIDKHGVSLGDLKTLSVVVRDPSYFGKFGTLLKETDFETLRNYLKWRVILNYINEVSGALRDVFFDFTKTTQGTTYPPPRWQICSDRANGAFGMALSYHYVQQVFNGDLSAQMSEMVGNIQDSFYEIIDEVEWMKSDDTRAKAKEKARKMSAFIGYPEWLIDNGTALDAYYNGLNLNQQSNYFHNLIEFSKWRNIESLKNLKETKDSKKWITDPTVVNAFYSSTYNSISFPAGILQPPFYFTGKPIQALNYGAVGMVIGHEISHGFDDRGRQSDGDGNLVDWWDIDTVNNYKERATCFINQYSTYSAEEAKNITLNGNNTLGENIADNGGLRQSFRAYQTFVKKHGTEPYLPGLEYTPEQLFFIAFSQIWCGSYTPQGMESQIRTGAHSPNRFRVKGVLENSLEFAETWNCPRPSPENVCRLW